MVSDLIAKVTSWLDSFAQLLDEWENTLRMAEKAYLSADFESIQRQTARGESIHLRIAAHKQRREELLAEANQLGFPARHLKALSQLLGSARPDSWPKKITSLELQLSRVQQLSVSLWLSALHSQSTVTEMLMILATGRTGSATYDPNESRSLEGGFLVNEAA